MLSVQSFLTVIFVIVGVGSAISIISGYAILDSNFNFLRILYCKFCLGTCNRKNRLTQKNQEMLLKSDEKYQSANEGLQNANENSNAFNG
jgi:hypothetical protein